VLFRQTQIGAGKMDTIEKEKIISKIKKLMALGMKDPDTHEAKTAMLKAKELMEKYDLETIDMNDDGSIDEKNVVREDITFNMDSRNWEIQIMGAIEKAFHCEYVIIPKRGGNSGKHVLVGSKTDINFAGFLFKYVRLQIMKMCDSYKYSGDDKKTYCMGCSFTVRKAILDTFVNQKKPVVNEKTEEEYVHKNSLIVLKHDAIEKRFKEIFPKLKKMRPMGALKGSMDAYSNGKSDGNKVKLNRQIHSNNLGEIS
jgi:hypothetical protein